MMTLNRNYCSKLLIETISAAQVITSLLSSNDLQIAPKHEPPQLYWPGTFEGGHMKFGFTEKKPIYGKREITFRASTIQCVC